MSALRKSAELLAQMAKRLIGEAAKDAQLHLQLMSTCRRDRAESWSGRGRAPKWLADELAKGRSRDEFLIGR